MNSPLIVVVNYNQEKEIKAFIIELMKFVKSKNILIVDDGSTDQSLKEIQSLKINTTTHGQNQGVGSAIRTGILKAKELGFQSIVVMSSNGKMLPSELSLIVQPLSEGIDYITGSRYINGVTSPGISNFRKWSIPLFSLFYSLLLGRKFSDITCGFRAYRIDFLFEAPINIKQKWLDTYEMEYYIHYYAIKKKLKIKEIPVTIRYDHLEAGRKSKIRPLIDWWKMTRPLLYLKLGIKK